MKIVKDNAKFDVGEFNIDGDIPISTVVLSQPPPPMFTYDQDGNNVQFVQLTSGVFTSFEWDFDSDGVIDSYDENPTYSYETEGDFSVVLTAYDDADCKNSYNAIVNVYASLLFYAPDIFTPNGDSHNDEFKVSIEIKIIKFLFIVLVYILSNISYKFFFSFF